MSDLGYEISGLREQMARDEDMADNPARYYLATLMGLCQAIADNASKSVPDHKHRLSRGEEFRTREVIPDGY